MYDNPTEELESPIEGPAEEGDDMDEETETVQLLLEQNTTVEYVLADCIPVMGSCLTRSLWYNPLGKA